jgi:hypothetical protein
MFFYYRCKVPLWIHIHFYTIFYFLFSPPLFASFILNFIIIILVFVAFVVYFGRDEKREPMLVAVNTVGTGRDKYRTLVMGQKVTTPQKKSSHTHTNPLILCGYYSI